MYKEPSFTERALLFALEAHGAQTRKYTGLPYITHPVEVANILREYITDNDLIAAAYLHDVLEDTPVTYQKLRKEFGLRTASFVLEVTDVSKPSDGNRAKRKAIDRAHLAKASYEGQSLKLADMIANTRDIAAHDPEFAKTYLAEKRLLLEVLTLGHPELIARARALL